VSTRARSGTLVELAMCAFSQTPRRTRAEQYRVAVEGLRTSGFRLSLIIFQELAEIGSMLLL
jgi:hypothetical protein